MNCSAEVRARIERDISAETRLAAARRYRRRLGEALGDRITPAAAGNRPPWTPPALAGHQDQPATMTGGHLRRLGDADCDEYAPTTWAAPVRDQARIEGIFQRICGEETGATESPEQTAKREAKERKLRAQGHTIAAALESAGVAGYRKAGADVFTLDVHELTLDAQPDFRRICLNPWIAHRLRVPVLAWLESFLKKHPFARFWTFTSGRRCQVHELRARLRYLHRRISKLNKKSFMREAGAEIVFRSSELGTVETERREATAGAIERDAAGAWYHPHAHCAVTLREKLDPEKWAALLRQVKTFWRHNWDEGKRIRDARECCKYVTKPGQMIALAKRDPAELAKLHEALFRCKLVQPLGALADEMRAAEKAGLILALVWKNDRREWSLIPDPNKNRFANGSEVVGTPGHGGEKLTRNKAHRLLTAHQYGPKPAGQDSPPFVRVVARCAPSFNSRGVKSPRVVILASSEMPAAEIVATALRHPLVRRLRAVTRDAYNAGLAIAKAERAELRLTGGTRGGGRPAAIRVHTATPTGPEHPPPDESAAADHHDPAEIAELFADFTA